MKPSKEAAHLVKEFTDQNTAPSVLDVILRDSDEARQRHSWTRIAARVGWYELFELPDMANHYLTCTEDLSKSAAANPDSITQPLSSVIMSTCALEAFINQVAFFIMDLKNSSRAPFITLPPELKSGALNFQRSVNLFRKWEIVGTLCCRSKWPIPEWRNVKILIELRNELVHFKSAEYEQVAPPQRRDVEIMRRIPRDISVRNLQRAWPYRLLTPSLAEWSLHSAQSAIVGFKGAYKENRLNLAAAQKTAAK